MATPQNSALARPNQTTPTLEAAAYEAGQHPDRVQAIAEGLGIAARTPARESILLQALSGAALPPPIHDKWWDAPPAGSFDAGVARVLAEDYAVDWATWVRGNNYPMVGDFPDHIARLGEEVRRSYGFARYAMMLTSGIRLAMEEGDPEAELQEDAAKDISRLAAVAFYAGWLMAMEYEDATSKARNAETPVNDVDGGAR